VSVSLEVGESLYQPGIPALVGELDDLIEVEFVGHNQRWVLSQKGDELQNAAKEVFSAKDLCRIQKIGKWMKERDNDILIPKHAVVNPLENLGPSGLPVASKKAIRLGRARDIQTCLKESLGLGVPEEKFFIGERVENLNSLYSISQWTIKPFLVGI
jgi:hypothetical protein